MKVEVVRMGNQVHLKIEHQMFRLSLPWDKEEQEWTETECADWYEKQLQTAVDRVNHQLANAQVPAPQDIFTDRGRP